MEGLSINGAASNREDGLHFVFRQLHGLKDSGEMAEADRRPSNHGQLHGPCSCGVILPSGISPSWESMRCKRSL